MSATHTHIAMIDSDLIPTECGDGGAASGILEAAREKRQQQQISVALAMNNRQTRSFRVSFFGSPPAAAIAASH